MAVDIKIAEELSKEIVTSLRSEDRLELNILNWALLETTLILKVQEMGLLDALDRDKLGEVIWNTLNHILGIENGDYLDKQLIGLLDKSLIQLVITQKGKLAYVWKF